MSLRSKGGGQMISYREKQLLAVMKYMQEQSAELARQLSVSIDETNEGKCISFKSPVISKVDSFDELCQLAEDAGYDTYIRAEDIMSKEELSDIEQRMHDIEAQFKDITKLQHIDYGFLMTAIALQIIRQVLQPKLDFESLGQKNRDDHDKAAAKTDTKSAEKKFKRALDDSEKRGIDPAVGKRLYYAPLSEIANIDKGVPYDETAISGVGGGTMHRFKTLGHDPVLGYLFGTCNILTNTLTTSNMYTRHVMREGRIVNVAKADTGEMFMHSKERFHENGGKLVVAAAVAKQVYHIKSDQKSKEGIGLPFLQLICDEKTIRYLCQEGIDFNALEFLGGIAKQSLWSELINFIIAISHRCIIAKGEYDTFCKDNRITNEATLKAVLKQKSLREFLFGDNKLTEVRTRKILLISNSVASSANIIYVGIVGGTSALAGNSEGVYNALSKLDVGGILITLKHLLSDTRVIAKIKDDFIKSSINRDFQEKLKKMETYYKS